MLSTQVLIINNYHSNTLVVTSAQNVIPRLMNVILLALNPYHFLYRLLSRDRRIRRQRQKSRVDI